MYKALHLLVRKGLNLTTTHSVRTNRVNYFNQRIVTSGEKLPDGYILQSGLSIMHLDDLNYVIVFKKFYWKQVSWFIHDESARVSIFACESRIKLYPVKLSIFNKWYTNRLTQRNIMTNVGYITYRILTARCLQMLWTHPLTQTVINYVVCNGYWQFCWASTVKMTVRITVLIFTLHVHFFTFYWITSISATLLRYI